MGVITARGDPGHAGSVIHPASLRVAFVQARAVDESLALCDVAGALLDGGHRPRLFLDRHERDVGAAVRRWDPDLIVVQAAILAEPWLASALRRLPATPPRILVGTGVTFDAEVLLRVAPGGDVGALRGEIDDSLLELVGRLARGARLDQALAEVDGSVGVVDGELVQRPLGPQPVVVGRPMPLRGLYFARYPFLGRFPWKRFAASRGCVHACGYCYAAPLRRLHQGAPRRVRRKTVDRVIAEALAVRGQWPLSTVHFADDLFASSIPWLEEFAGRWPREVGLPFSANTSGETLSDRAAALLAKAGARLIGLGLESGVEEVRGGGLGRTTPDAVIRAGARRLKEHGIEVQTFNMVGAPGETFEQALETLRFNHELGVDRVRATLAWPMPGSDMHDQAADRALPDASTARKDRMEAVCVDDPRRFESLARLFRLAAVSRMPLPLVEQLTKLPPSALSGLALFDGFQELRWSGVSMPAGLAYAARAGKPIHRVTYHAALP
jgi:anaerobic magnesium-protoporphyrin IX monomethyl ester cyclase